MSELGKFWAELLEGPGSARILDRAMAHAAQGLAEMIGQPVDHTPATVKQMALAQVAACAGDPEAPAVGVYLKIESGLVGWALLCMPLDLALHVANRVLQAPPAAGARLGRLQKSALAEVGNLALSYFLNAVAEETGAAGALLPSPPAVIVDMLGVILNLMVGPAVAVSDRLMTVESLFREAGRPEPICFWIAPDMGSR